MAGIIIIIIIIYTIGMITIMIVYL